jgi:hypothetical protein
MSAVEEQSMSMPQGDDCSKSKATAMKSKPIPTDHFQAPIPEFAGESNQKEACRSACPVCGGRLLDIRRKLCCIQCHRIVETCCD